MFSSRYVFQFKTHAQIEIKPFIVYFNREHPWVDASTLILEWLYASNVKSGYLFRTFNAFDQLNLDKNQAVVCICQSNRDVTEFLSSHIACSCMISEPTLMSAAYRLNCLVATHSDEVESNISRLKSDGHYESSVTGEDGP